MTALAQRLLSGRGGELCEPGTQGMLCLCAETEQHGTVEHEGRYVYVGLVRGLHAFAPAGEAPVVFLHRKEVVSFRPEKGKG